MSFSKKPIYEMGAEPMRIVLFSSGGPGNTNALLKFCDENPKLATVVLCVADRFGIPTLDIARQRNIPTIIVDFASHLRECKKSIDFFEHKMVSERLHDEILNKIFEFERTCGRLDLAVLAYRRIISGRLLKYFEDRMINQHPADLSIYNIFGSRCRERRYVGIDGHKRALLDGNGGSRTCTILVNGGIDEGEIICSGPFVPYVGDFSMDSIKSHEDLQKSHSDWPALIKSIQLISTGRIFIGNKQSNGSLREIYLDNSPLPYAGYSL